MDLQSFRHKGITQPREQAQSDTWDDFDPIEYVMRHYGKLLPEDRILIQAAIANLKRFPSKRTMRVADVGTGPNFYPAMLLSSLVEQAGQVDLIELSKPNRAFMNTLLGSSDSIYRNKNKLGKVQSVDTHEPWQKFDRFIAELGRDARFQNSFTRARSLAESISGDISNLPESTYDFFSSFFVAESITSNKRECVQALAALIGAVRPGGGFMVALMVGSKGWPAGEATHFPAVDLSLQEIKDIFNALPGVTGLSVIFAEDAYEKTREGYHGMAIVMGRCRKIGARS